MIPDNENGSNSSMSVFVFNYIQRIFTMLKSVTHIDKNMPILVVDHLPMVRRMVKNCLRQLGFENIHEAENGEGAAQRLGEDTFQLVISDSEMPDMDPIELLSKVRSDPQSKDTPVLFVTSATAKSADRFQDSRAAVIVKPFTAQQIEKRLQEML